MNAAHQEPFPRARPRSPRRSGWAGWDSGVPFVWLWHALFDGTPLCRCAHSRYLAQPRHRKAR